MYEFLDYCVQDVMSQPMTLELTATLGDVEALLEARGFNSVPIVDRAGDLVGIVTSLDLLRAFDFAEDAILPPYTEVMKRGVESVMKRDVQSVTPLTPLTRLVQKLVDSRNKSFPVVDGQRVIGVVAREDVMVALRQGTAGKRP